MGNIWRNIALVKAESKLTGQEQGGNLELSILFTFEKGRRCLRFREEKHAEWRGNSRGHDGGVEYQGSRTGIA